MLEAVRRGLGTLVLVTLVELQLGAEGRCRLVGEAAEPEAVVVGEFGDFLGDPFSRVDQIVLVDPHGVGEVHDKVDVDGDVGEGHFKFDLKMT